MKIPILGFAGEPDQNFTVLVEVDMLL